MLLNTFLFPAPQPPQYTLRSHGRNLFAIPAKAQGQYDIPCMFYSPQSTTPPPDYLMILCHGNGCDLGGMHYTLTQLCHRLNVYVISFEYPGYGLCTGLSPSQDTINEHADRTYDFVREVLQWPAERILIYGHSIGSGPANYIASTREIGALILQSPYTSIRDLVKEKVGVLSVLVHTRMWDSMEAMKKITCPVLFIHGLDDTLIPPHHSEILYAACSNGDRKRLVLLRHEDHNSMSENTLIQYISQFLQQYSGTLNRHIVIPNITKPATSQARFGVSSDHSSSTGGTGIVSSLLSLSQSSVNASVATFEYLAGKRDDNNH